MMEENGTERIVTNITIPQIWQPEYSFIELFFFFEKEVVINITSKHIRKRASVEPALSRMLEYCQVRWPHEVAHCLEPYLHSKNDLTL